MTGRLMLMSTGDTDMLLKLEPGARVRYYLPGGNGRVATGTVSEYPADNSAGDSRYVRICFDGSVGSIDVLRSCCAPII